MTETEKIKEGLEIAYRRMVEFKKYKKTPIVVSKNGKIVEISPYDVPTEGKVYK